MSGRYQAYNQRQPSSNGLFRSMTEERVASALEHEGIQWQYEDRKFRYSIIKKYTPDFTLHFPHGDVYLEVKGWWPSQERTKMKTVIKQNPELHIVMVLERPNAAISRDSKTSYSDWCDKHGIEWCPFPIPVDKIRQWATPLSLRQDSPAPVVTAPTQPPATQMDIFSVSPAVRP